MHRRISVSHYLYIYVCVYIIIYIAPINIINGIMYKSILMKCYNKHNICIEIFSCAVVLYLYYSIHIRMRTYTVGISNNMHYNDTNYYYNYLYSFVLWVYVTLNDRRYLTCFYWAYFIR